MMHNIYTTGLLDTLRAAYRANPYCIEFNVSNIYSGVDTVGTANVSNVNVHSSYPPGFTDLTATANAGMEQVRAVGIGNIYSTGLVDPVQAGYQQIRYNPYTGMIGNTNLAHLEQQSANNLYASRLTDTRPLQQPNSSSIDFNLSSIGSIANISVPTEMTSQATSEDPGEASGTSAYPDLTNTAPDLHIIPYSIPVSIYASGVDPIIPSIRVVPGSSGQATPSFLGEDLTLQCTLEDTALSYTPQISESPFSAEEGSKPLSSETKVESSVQQTFERSSSKLSVYFHSPTSNQQSRSADSTPSPTLEVPSSQSSTNQVSLSSFFPRLAGDVSCRKMNDSEFPPLPVPKSRCSLPVKVSKESQSSVQDSVEESSVPSSSVNLDSELPPVCSEIPIPSSEATLSEHSLVDIPDPAILLQYPSSSSTPHHASTINSHMSSFSSRRVKGFSSSIILPETQISMTRYPMPTYTSGQFPMFPYSSERILEQASTQVPISTFSPLQSSMSFSPRVQIPAFSPVQQRVPIFRPRFPPYSTALPEYPIRVPVSQFSPLQVPISSYSSVTVPYSLCPTFSQYSPVVHSPPCNCALYTFAPAAAAAAAVYGAGAGLQGSAVSAPESPESQID